MSRNIQLAVVSAAMLALGPATASAEEPRFGLQLHASLPNGDLKTAVDNKPGAGLGAHVTFDLGGGHVLRPRFDAVFFPEGAFNGFKTKAHDLSLGGDYLYFPGGKPDGLYLTAGLGLHRWTVDTTTPAVGSSPATSGTQSSSRFGYAAGFGYNFNRSVGTELRFVRTHYANQTAWDPSANSLQAGVTYRF
ncbi:MAG: porin family protein [Geothrix sp.]|uniref:outer membrane beta-barrel protein n=1 Tax=Geothrix sp. TaxID=1962974 RepID=UPI00180B292D|nr:outer membrane beta-barrel protein [Geothrix sp.]NWJ41315.1 porin family protein [Geothrix sp.]WIL20697.1 MAG: porin family protein [Geothrix sp.]